MSGLDGSRYSLLLPQQWPGPQALLGFESMLMHVVIWGMRDSGMTECFGEIFWRCRSHFAVCMTSDTVDDGSGAWESLEQGCSLYLRVSVYSVHPTVSAVAIKGVFRRGVTTARSCWLMLPGDPQLPFMRSFACRTYAPQCDRHWQEITCRPS